MSTKPKELLEAERVWTEASRAYKAAVAATDQAHKVFREAANLKAQKAAWKLLYAATAAEHKASSAYYKAENALTALFFRLEYPNPCGGEFTPRSSRVAWSPDPEKRKRQRKHIAESIAAKNPAPSSIARGGKKLEKLERTLGSAVFIYRASETEGNRRAVHRAMKDLETYRKKVGINPIENPARAVNNLVTLLGAALELVVKPPRGRQFSYDWHEETPKRHALCCPGDLKAVFIFDATNPKAVAVPAGAAAERAAWRMWSSFNVDGALRFSVPSGVAGVYLGAAKVIRYRSDKWTGKDLNYEHRFGAGVQVFADNKQHPRVIFITADPPKRLVTARGIVG